MLGTSEPPSNVRVATWLRTLPEHPISQLSGIIPHPKKLCRFAAILAMMRGHTNPALPH